MPEPELQSFLAVRRRAAGLSTTGLAERVGVSRQALAAIEAGRSTPSTALSLRLARVLRCSVEELFSLEPTVDRFPELAGARVALGQVDGRWVAHALDPRLAEPADGLIAADGTVEALTDLRALEQGVLVAGCAPILGLLAGHLREARWLQRSSGASLRALAEGRVHLAGLHLAASDRPDEHERIVREHLPHTDLHLVQVVLWREGLALAPGNPRGLTGAEDLAQSGLRVAQRSSGSGAASVLRSALSLAGVVERLDGPRVASHLDAAQAVLHGSADTAVLVEPVAQAFGLGFLPLSEERFELVLRSADRDHPGVARVLDLLSTAPFAREVRHLGAYDVGSMGDARVVAA